MSLKGALDLPVSFSSQYMVSNFGRNKVLRINFNFISSTPICQWSILRHTCTRIVTGIKDNDDTCIMYLLMTLVNLIMILNITQVGYMREEIRISVIKEGHGNVKCYTLEDCG